MSKYIQKLQDQYEEYPDMDKMVFVADIVFDFTVYDDELSKEIGYKMLEVIECILNGTTFEYQKISDENYRNFILMCNMPFLNNKLDYGTSIRGAWFDDYPKEPYNIQPLGVVVEGKEIKQFMLDLITWARQ